MRPAAATASRAGGWLFWSSAAAGVALIAVGVRGIWIDRSATQPTELARWFLGAGIGHDGVWAPVVVVVGWLTCRMLPAVARIPVRIGLASTAVIVVVAWPLVPGWGRRATNPSALPLDYGRNLALVVAGIWVGVTVAIVIAVIRTRRT